MSPRSIRAAMSYWSVKQHLKNMSIGDKIIREIRIASLFKTLGSDGKEIDSGLIYVWQACAAEQLEAMVESHIEERVRIRLELDKQNDTARLNWLESADIMIQFNTLDAMRFNDVMPGFPAHTGPSLRYCIDQGIKRDQPKPDVYPAD